MSGVPFHGPKANFADWSYLQARSELWPIERLPSNWSPGRKPAENLSKPIDDEIVKLLAPKDGRSPGIDPELRPFGKLKTRDGKHSRRAYAIRGYLKQYGLLEPFCAFDPFCPFKEIRAHWIPLALQVARSEAERHFIRTQQVDHSQLRNRLIDIMERAVAALEEYCSYDAEALAFNDRPMLKRWIKKPKDGRAPGAYLVPAEDNCDAAQLRTDENPLYKYGSLKDFISVRDAAAAKPLAHAAREAIANNLEQVRNEIRDFYLARKNQREWEISFASTLGFAWRRLTGRNPSAATESPFCQFVNAAYRSLDPSSSADWDAICRSAVERYSEDFDEAEFDPMLLSVTTTIWREISGPPKNNSYLRDAIIKIMAPKPKD